MNTTSYTVCPPEIITHIISYLTPESAIAFYLVDLSIRKLFTIESDVKTALRNRDIVNLMRLSETTFPIDKETYVLACASGIMKFIELLEKRNPRALKEYSTDIHKCISWGDAGLIAAINNKRVKVVKKLMIRKTKFSIFTNIDITRAAFYSRNAEIIQLIDACYEETLRHGGKEMCHIIMEAITYP